MDKIDWSKAPEWADRALRWMGESVFFSDGVNFLNSRGDKVLHGEVTNYNEKGEAVDWWFEYKEDYLIEMRPKPCQEGEERMSNIGQNGNNGHYDAVNHPEHYQSESGIECIDAIRASLGLDGFVAYCRGNAIKYSWRSGKKSEHAEDLRKAAWYLERAAQELEKSK